jgi:hypothetical protein
MHVRAGTRLNALDGFDAAWPAGIAHDHADAQIWTDEASSS